MENIDIALLSNQAYAEGLAVTAVSLAAYAHPATRLRFHVLDGGIKDTTYEHFCATVRRLHAHTEFRRHRIDETMFADWPAWSGNRMTYARLLLPQLLPECERVIYTDTDVMWLAPVEDLWHEFDGKAMVLACQDWKQTRQRENAWYARKGLAAPGEDYFCAGVMVVNLAGFRAENMTARIFEFLSAHTDAKFADQTALNTLLHGRVKMLDTRWQTLTPSLTRGCLPTPIVLHYANEVPWRQKSRWALLSDAALLWHDFNDICVSPGDKSSLRRHYSLGEILFKRTLFLSLQHRFCARLIIWGSRLLRRPDIAAHLGPYQGRELGRKCRMHYRRFWKQLASHAKA